MPKRLFRIILCVATAAPSSVLAQPAKPPAPAAATGRCAGLAADWKNHEMALADNQADGITDNSAPRATMRAAQDTATFAQAQITLRLIELNRCPLPVHPPVAISYFTNALSCKTAQLRASAEQMRAGLPECERSTWTPIAR